MFHPWSTVVPVGVTHFEAVIFLCEVIICPAESISFSHHWHCDVPCTQTALLLHCVGKS